jgi:calcium-dependent protein kinase
LPKDKATRETERILSNIDINQNGSVDFTEFVISLVSTKDILTDEKLLNAFNMLDMDGNGRITKSDLEAVFKKNSSTDTNEAMEEIIQEADVNGTGEIAFNDFK